MINAGERNYFSWLIENDVIIFNKVKKKKNYNLPV